MKDLAPIATAFAFSALLQACSAPNPVSAGSKSEGTEILSRMRTSFRSASSYVDKGLVTFSDARGNSHQIEFSTTFVRPGQLRFEAAEPPLAWSLAVDGDAVQVAHPEGTSAMASLENASRALAGVTSLSSMVVPMLLWGKDFCNCMDHGDAVLVGVEPIDGATCFRVELPRLRGDRVVLWIDREYFLRRVEWWDAADAKSPRVDKVAISYSNVSHR